MACYNIMAVIINNRSKRAPLFQEILTKYGCLIKMRLGLHETGNVCVEEGLIILQLDGSEEEIKQLEGDLNKLDGIKAKTMNVCGE